MTDISCKNLSPKECRDIYILHQFSSSLNRHQKLRQTCRESAIVALSHNVKISFCKCFMENKNIIRTFCGCKLSKKGIWPHQIFTGS